jgi:putative addiction module component (TIGR02574 family)
MNIESTKYAIIEKIIETDSEELLDEIRSLLGQTEESFTEEQKKELDQRAIRHKNDESKSYSWDEVKQRARSSI